jgi:hypothetical protein
MATLVARDRYNWQDMSSTSKKKQEGDWRARAEAKRKAAVDIRARYKRRKAREARKEEKEEEKQAQPKGGHDTANEKQAGLNDGDDVANATPTSCDAANGTKPSSSSSNGAVATTSTVTSTPQDKEPLPTPSTLSSTAPPPTERPPQTPIVKSAWGDCRLDLWEAICTCGGERKSPDTRMCRCLAVGDAGLACSGCNAGVLLIKDGPRGNFWGCSQYKKHGCKFTMRFGPPHDAAAGRRLAAVKGHALLTVCVERERESRVADPFEVEWLSYCHCGGARALNTYECFMESEGGCGVLPACPKRCGGSLFLKQSRYGDSRWWGCSNYKSGRCKFSKTYIEHRSSN